jgi:hypothetical protein
VKTSYGFDSKIPNSASRLMGVGGNTGHRVCAYWELLRLQIGGCVSLLPNLSPYQRLARKQIELYDATEKDLEDNAQERNRPICLRQVGIRCLHSLRKAVCQGTNQGFRILSVAPGGCLSNHSQILEDNAQGRNRPSCLRQVRIRSWPNSQGLQRDTQGSP